MNSKVCNFLQAKINESRVNIFDFWTFFGISTGNTLETSLHWAKNKHRYDGGLFFGNCPNFPFVLFLFSHFLKKVYLDFYKSKWNKMSLNFVSFPSTSLKVKSKLILFISHKFSLIIALPGRWVLQILCDTIMHILFH